MPAERRGKRYNRIIHAAHGALPSGGLPLTQH
jgi:hypothetical protein